MILFVTICQKRACVWCVFSLHDVQWTFIALSHMGANPSLLSCCKGQGSNFTCNYRHKTCTHTRSCSRLLILLVWYMLVWHYPLLESHYMIYTWSNRIQGIYDHLQIWRNDILIMLWLVFRGSRGGQVKVVSGLFVMKPNSLSLSALFAHILSLCH